jgi:hypothetical protein
MNEGIGQSEAIAGLDRLDLLANACVVRKNGGIDQRVLGEVDYFFLGSNR